MSAWSWVARIGGYVAAPFTGGASIPIGEAVAQGISNQEASSKANQQLQAGNDKAIGLYGQTFAPYLNSGAQASNTLAGMMGFAPSGASNTGAPMATPAAEPMPTRTRPEDAPVTGQAYPRGTLASLGQMPTQSSYAKVRMIAPDGEQAEVDEREVGLFERQGARRL